jgi:dTDP-glucose pyrophosphorylase
MTSQSEQVWKSAILYNNSTIRQAVQVLNETALKIVLIVEESEKFIGTISDGDIRRGLLQGLDLSSPIETIIHRDALVVNLETTREEVSQLMSQNKIQQIPIVNARNHLIGLHLWDELNTPPVRANKMIIMAGGKGTRLHPQTKKCPKPMLLISGKPILEHILMRAKSEGFSSFTLAINYLGNIIEDYFEDGARFGVQIEYLREQFAMGTAGALSLLNPIPDSPFVVTNGDVITEIRYGEMLNFHEKLKAKATMAIRTHEYQNPFGVVETNGFEISSYIEKPVYRTHINAGVYVLDPSTLQMISKLETLDMPTLFNLIQSNLGTTIAYPIHEEWMDVGRPNDLRIANLGNKSKGE